MFRAGAIALAAIFFIAATPILAPLHEGGRDNHSHKTGSPNTGQRSAPVSPPRIKPQPKNEQTSNVSQEAGHRPKEGGWLGIPFDGWVAIFTGLLFLATGGLFIFTGLLWRTTGTLIEEERENSARELRAYVGVTTGSVVFEHFEGGLRPRATLRIKNYGLTPAYAVASSVRIETGNKFCETMNANLKPVTGNSSIFPQDSVRLIFPGEIVEPTGEGPLGIFIFGTVTYRDAFKRPQWAKFRFAGYFKDGLFAPADLAPEDEGNEAT